MNKNRCLSVEFLTHALVIPGPQEAPLLTMATTRNLPQKQSTPAWQPQWMLNNEVAPTKDYWLESNLSDALYQNYDQLIKQASKQRP